MMCIQPKCEEEAIYECVCRNQAYFFCEIHYSRHLLDCSEPTHIPIELQRTINPQSKRLVSMKLEDLLKRVVANKNQLIQDFPKIVEKLEKSFHEIIFKLDEAAKNLRNFIRNLTVNERSLPDCRVKQVIVLSQDEALTEVRTWDKIYNFTLKSKEISQTIEAYGTIYQDFDFLFTNNNTSPSIHVEKINDTRKIDFSKKSINESSGTKSESTFRVKDRKYEENKESKSKTMKSILPYKVNPKCPENHEMKWSIFVTFQSFKSSNSFYISCDKCSFTFSSSCWNCSSCDYKLCEKCGNEIGSKSPKIKCLKNHELIWKPDTCFYYNMKGLGFGFTCKSCQIMKTEPSWNCRDCNFDLCKDCGIKNFNLKPLFYTPKCGEFHTLSVKELKLNKINGNEIYPKCSSCKDSFEGEALICKICKYFFLCPECREYHERPVAGHPILSCRKHHWMRWAKATFHKCDLCYRNFNTERYLCRECDFDICIECSDILINVIVSNKKKTHRLDHPLTWKCNPIETGNKDIFCSCCKVKFDKAGMFCCKVCDVAFCAPCYQNPKRVKRKIDRIVD